MPAPIRLVITLHNHQPVGNFDGVFESAYQDSYWPFLDVLEEFPHVKITLHNSGSLLEWLEVNHPEYIERLRQLAARGQIEILGGPRFEPILASIPRRDRIGQMQSYSRHLEELFGVAVRGMWMPERVWEQSFAADIADAGIEYTIVDDSHFRGAGVDPDKMFGYYLTEDEGKLIKVFPIAERLRYTIPFAAPQETIDFLRDVAEKSPGAIAAFGDDGEKFGVWPETKKHVYDNGWLRNFFALLGEHQDWIEVCTLAEAVDSTPPLGRIYLPDASYREMMEWALPTDQFIAYQNMVKEAQADTEHWDAIRQFVSAGFWRNFLVKYPESNEMYCRMREVSERLLAISDSPAAREHPHLLAAARTELYRGQCNCPYWHGAFGGLYLPHLRNAIYRHLIAADTAIEQLAGREGRWVEVAAEDYNLDARKEVRLASDRLVAYLAPARGGHLYELDIRGPRVNLLATLNRRAEPYHERVRVAAASQPHDDGAEHFLGTDDHVKLKQPGLHEKLGYDFWPRKSLVDHILTPDCTLNDLWHGEGDEGDFTTGVYHTRLQRSDDRVAAKLTRNGRAGDTSLTITKIITLDAQQGTLLDIRYELTGMEPGQSLRLGIEFNFAAMPAGADDRYFYDAHGQQLGQLGTCLDIDSTDRIGLVDEWLGIDASLDFSQPAGLWTFPIQTVSNSEGGFELVHQSVAVIPHWNVTADGNGEWSINIRMAVDTSAAQARQLAEMSAG
ncbi:MAG: alpha-amylase/4-alpha-glucanotransferase domain-containing protein [Planctomycetaceae bacterium]